MMEGGDLVFDDGYGVVILLLVVLLVQQNLLLVVYLSQQKHTFVLLSTVKKIKQRKYHFVE